MGVGRASSLLGAVALLLGSAPTFAASPLGLEDAIRRAIDENPVVRAARAGLEGAAAEARAARGARVPTLSLSSQAGHSESLAASADTIAPQEQQRIEATAALSLRSDVGTEIEVSASTGIDWRSTNLDPSRSVVFNLGPLYSSQLGVEVRQPLLRGAGEDAALGAQHEAEARALAAQRALEDTVSQLAVDVSSAHRELWYAQQSLRIAAESTSVAKTQYQQSKLRFEDLGSVPRTEVLRYASELASTRRAYETARESALRAALDLGQLLGLEPTGAAALVAATSTLAPAAPASLHALTAKALERSGSLLELRANLHAASIRLRAAEDAAQTRVDVLGQAQTSVLFDSDTIRDLDLPLDRPALSALIGLEVELPLGASQLDGAVDVALADKSAASAALRAAEQQIVNRVATQRAALIAARTRIALTESEALSAADLAEAERQKLRLGTGTALEVLQAQQTERDARLLHLRAQVDYALAVVQLAHDTGTLVGGPQ